MKPIEKLLDYSFKNQALLEEALTHPSLAGVASYQRLEFLGDRVLGLAIATWLYEGYSDEDEGHLNRRFSSLVRGETLAEMTLSLGLDVYIRMTPSAKSDGTDEKPAVLADICEAVIGAIYLDGGIQAATIFIRNNWASLMEEGPSDRKDAKSKLQEWSQKRALPLPRYNEISREGPAHQPIFTIEATIDGYGSAQATGTSKQQAQQVSARQLLDELEK